MWVISSYTRLEWRVDEADREEMRGQEQRAQPWGKKQQRRVRWLLATLSVRGGCKEGERSVDRPFRGISVSPSWEGFSTALKILSEILGSLAKNNFGH